MPDRHRIVNEEVVCYCCGPPFQGIKARRTPRHFELGTFGD
jgi:hypothetical protein